MQRIEKYLALGLLLVFDVKAMILGLSWEVIALNIILASLFYALEHKQQDKKIKQLEERIEKEYAERLKALEEANKQQDLILSDLRSSVSSLRVAGGFNPTSFSGAKR